MDDGRRHLLFLCHRIPYPPDKGDKIRSHRWWTELVEHFHVHLGAFIDDPRDWAHVRTLEAQCESSLFLALPRRRALLTSLGGFLDGTALSLAYYRNARMRRWAQERLASCRIGYVLVFSSAMAQYVDDARWSAVRRVIDFVDVDSDKWRQYAQRKSWPASWIYNREAQRLAQQEQRLARIFDASVFVSEAEAQLFCTGVPDIADRISAISNGVDAAYFQVAAERLSPFPAASEPVVFTGAMDYWANVDAVLWFVREVWPRVKQVRPRALFCIVGARPAPAIEALRRDGIQVTGRVPDIRPYLQHAQAVVAPMRIARGIQNKVLEGMAMGKPLVVTSKGLEGIAAMPGRDLLVADDPTAFAEAVVSLLAGRPTAIGASARRLVTGRYAWADAAQALIAVMLATR